MKLRLALLIAAFALAGCAPPLADQPTLAPPAPTAAQPTATPREPAPTGSAEATAVPARPTPGALSPTEPSVGATPAAPSAVPDQAQGVDDPATLAAAAPAARDQVALARAFKHIGDVPTVARTTPLAVKVGDVEQFWVADHIDNTR